MIKAIGLIRVSTEEQSRHAGVPAQRHAIQTIAQQRGIELVKTFEITDVSGSRLLASPEFHEFLSHLEEPSIQAVVTKEFSRLMRPENFSDYIILQCFVDHSITLHLPDGPIDFSKKFDKFIGPWTVVRIPNVFVLYLSLAALSITLTIVSIVMQNIGQTFIPSVISSVDNAPT